MSKIQLINGSCADQTADVVVNAANSGLWAGGGICGVIFRKAGMQELTEACDIGKLVYGDILGAVLIYIITDIHEFLNIFMLLVCREIAETAILVVKLTSEVYEEADEQGIDPCFIIRRCSEIFRFDLEHVIAQDLRELIPDLVVVLCTDDGIGMEVVEQRIHTS